MNKPQGESQIENLFTRQRDSWLRGERAPLENYLAGHPDFAPNDEQILDFIYAEICLREELGETPLAEEYEARFPKLAGLIRALFEVHDALGRDELLAESEDAEAATRPRLDPPGKEVSGNLARTQAWPGKLRVPVEAAGAVIGNYEVLGTLGRGGMGVVYKARHRELNRIRVMRGAPTCYTQNPLPACAPRRDTPRRFAKPSDAADARRRRAAQSVLGKLGG